VLVSEPGKGMIQSAGHIPFFLALGTYSIWSSKQIEKPKRQNMNFGQSNGWLAGLKVESALQPPHACKGLPHQRNAHCIGHR
jgi:hypothetical protein